VPRSRRSSRISSSALSARSRHDAVNRHELLVVIHVRFFLSRPLLDPALGACVRVCASAMIELAPVFSYVNERETPASWATPTRVMGAPVRPHYCSDSRPTRPSAARNVHATKWPCVSLTRWRPLWPYVCPPGVRHTSSPQV
jgi:hypothetical protein